MLVGGVRGSALVKTRNLREAVEVEAGALPNHANGEQKDALLTVLRQGSLVTLPCNSGAK